MAAAAAAAQGVLSQPQQSQAVSAGPFCCCCYAASAAGAWMTQRRSLRALEDVHKQPTPATIAKAGCSPTRFPWTWATRRVERACDYQKTLTYCPNVVHRGVTAPGWLTAPFLICCQLIPYASWTEADRSRTNCLPLGHLWTASEHGGKALGHRWRSCFLNVVSRVSWGPCFLGSCGEHWVCQRVMITTISILAVGFACLSSCFKGH